MLTTVASDLPENVVSALHRSPDLSGSSSWTNWLGAGWMLCCSISTACGMSWHVAEHAAVDTPPFIFLARGGLLELLHLVGASSFYR